MWCLPVVTLVVRFYFANLVSAILLTCVQFLSLSVFICRRCSTLRLFRWFKRVVIFVRFVVLSWSWLSGLMVSYQLGLFARKLWRPNVGIFRGRPLTFDFLRATVVPAGTAEARISYGNSVHLSRPGCGFNATWWDRDSGSSPYGSLESLVSYEVIWCHWVKRFPSKEGIKEGYPP